MKLPDEVVVFTKKAHGPAFQEESSLSSEPNPNSNISKRPA